MIVVASLDAALSRAAASTICNDKEIVVIGGGTIYREAVEHADRLYITHVEASPEGDTYFPMIDPAKWRRLSEVDTPAGPKDSVATTFVVYERVSLPHTSTE